jgi:hypothetical protein
VSDAVNPPPPELAHTTFIVREAVALLFVGGWLLLFAVELLTGAYTLPFWVHCLAVAVLAYALGVDVAELTSYRPPSRRQVVRRVVAGREEDG